MRRDIENTLIQWKRDKTALPIIMLGIRQCGKTWTLKEFGKNHFNETLYLNFEGNKSLVDVFSRDLDVRRIVLELEGLSRKHIDENTLLIFDEVQFCPAALTSLKYFAEELPNLKIACAGSLLGVHLSHMGTNLSFPVGKVKEIRMYPLSFAEFLLANGEEILYNYVSELSVSTPVPESLTEKLKNYYRDYLITGGMPAVVSHWIQNHDVDEVEEILDNILNNYSADFAKHAPLSDQAKIFQIWEAIPAQLAKDNQKFIFSQVKTGARAKDLEDALEWLVASGLIYKITRVERPDIPLSQFADDSYFKVYLADIGLLRRMSAISPSALFSRGADTGLMRGMFAENFVLTELMAMKGGGGRGEGSGGKNGDVNVGVRGGVNGGVKGGTKQNWARDMRVHFWKSNRGAEVEFLLQIRRECIPVEVKAGVNTRSKSLAEFRKRYLPKIALRISLTGDGIKEDEFGVQYSVPLYRVWALAPEILKSRN